MRAKEEGSHGDEAHSARATRGLLGNAASRRREGGRVKTGNRPSLDARTVGQPTPAQNTYSHRLKRDIRKVTDGAQGKGAVQANNVFSVQRYVHTDHSYSPRQASPAEYIRSG